MDSSPLEKPFEGLATLSSISRLSSLLPSSPLSSSSSSPSSTFTHDVPSVLSVSNPPVTFSLASATGDRGGSRDRLSFPSSAALLSLQEEIKMDQDFGALLEQGRSHVATLYTYRCVSKAMPVVKAEMSEAEKNGIHMKSFTVLRTEVIKLKAIMDYSGSLVKAIVSALGYVQKQEADKKVPSEHLFRVLMMALDLAIQIDALKSAKTSVLNDLSRYNRNLSAIAKGGMHLDDSTALNDESSDLSSFFRSHNVLLTSLRQGIQNVLNFDATLFVLLNFACDQLDEKRYIQSDEMHRFARLSCHLLYLADTDPKDATKKPQINVFKYQGKNRLDIDRVKRLVRTLPIVPMYMDMHIDLLFVLRLVPHWEEERMKADWSPKLNNQKFIARYSLVQQRTKIRTQFNDFLINFTQQVNVVQSSLDTEQALNSVTLRAFTVLILEGLRLLGEWQSAVATASAYKYANPEKDKAGANPYEKAVRYNYNNEELYALADLLAMSKSLGTQLLSHLNVIELIIRRCIHDDLQSFLQLEVGEAARKASKHNRNQAQSLMLAMRDLAGDWRNEAQRNNWKSKNPNYSIDASSFSIPAELSSMERCQAYRDFLPRASVASLTQIRCIRRLAHMLFNERSSGMQGTFFSGDRDLSKEQANIWKDFYDWSFYWEHLLSASRCITQSVDFSFLWYREFYLELTKAIQFPLSMSLPWILTEFLIKRNIAFGNNSKTNLFYALDIYNDAANQALYSLSSRFLFDEIEAELNLSFEQMVYGLARDCFKYYKTLAHETLIKNGYMKKYLAAAKANSSRVQRPPVKENRYIYLLEQRHITLLGRDIDLNASLTESINGLLREYLEIALRRFEASDLTQVIEFEYILRVWRALHDSLRAVLPGLDDALLIITEVNEDTVLGQHNTRTLFHILSELVNDLLPNYIYNCTTQRFVQAPQTFVERPERPRAPSNQSSFFFGTRHAAMLTEYFSLFRNYFGHEHIRALSMVLNASELPVLCEELNGELHDKLHANLAPYLDYLLEVLPQFATPDVNKYQVLGVFGMIDVKLRNSLGTYKQLRDCVFQYMREIGNLLAFVEQLEVELRIFRNTSFLFTAHFHSIKGQLNVLRTTDTPFLVRSDNLHEASYVTAIKESGAFFNSSSALSTVYSNISTLAAQSQAIYQYSEREHGESIIASFLDRALVSIEKQHSDRWRGNDLQTNDITRLLSCLLFVYCQPNDPRAKPNDVATMYMGKDASLFGDGWIYTLVLVLQSMKEWHEFELQDYCYLIQELEELHPIDRTKFVPKGAKSPALSDSDRDEYAITEFLRNFKAAKEKMKMFSGLIERVMV